MSFLPILIRTRVTYLTFMRWLVEQESMSRESEATARIAENLGEHLSRSMRRSIYFGTHAMGPRCGPDSNTIRQPLTNSCLWSGTWTRFGPSARSPTARL